MIFPKFMVAAISTLRTPRLIFHSSFEWLLLEINACNCVRLMPRQRTQVYTLIQTDLSKPEVSFFFLSCHSFFVIFEKKKSWYGFVSFIVLIQKKAHNKKSLLILNSVNCFWEIRGVTNNSLSFVLSLWFGIDQDCYFWLQLGSNDIIARFPD